MYSILFFDCRLYPSSPSHRGSVWLLPVISLLLTNIVSRVRACLSLWLERFRGSQKQDERVPSWYIIPLWLNIRDDRDWQEVDVVCLSPVLSRTGWPGQNARGFFKNKAQKVANLFDVVRIRIRGPGSGTFLTPGSGIQNRFFSDPGSQTHIF